MKRRFQLLPVAIFSLLFFLLNWYILGGLRVVLTYPAVPLIFWPTILVITLTLLFAVQGIRSRGMGIFFKITTHSFLILFVSELLFAAVVILGDGYRLLAGLIKLIQGQQFILPLRNQYWIEIGIGLFLISVLLFFYGISKGKYAYRVIKHQLYFDDLPSSFDGFTLTQISDVHAGSFTNAKAVQKGIDLINVQKSDLFVFTGDLVNNKADEIKSWIGHFSQIRAPFGQFSVLGNHDYGDYVSWKNDQAKNDNLEQLALSYCLTSM
jgi:hypothetical protein